MLLMMHIHTFMYTLPRCEQMSDVNTIYTNYAHKLYNSMCCNLLIYLLWLCAYEDCYMTCLKSMNFEEVFILAILNFYALVLIKSYMHIKLHFATMQKLISSPFGIAFTWKGSCITELPAGSMHCSNVGLFIWRIFLIAYQHPTIRSTW